MALKTSQNKMQTADTTKDGETFIGVDTAQSGAEATAYFFPDYQCTIQAESLESALEQLKAKFPKADIEQLN